MSHEPITEGVNFIEATEVADKLQGHGNLVIIDVREPEEIERDGFISGKVNIPSSKFKDIDRAKSILLEHKDKDEIVVHCLKSQQRGPTCALALSQALEELHTNGVEHPLPLIKVLRGGFHEFNAKYGNSDLVEK